jgi:hypothetical protein
VGDLADLAHEAQGRPGPSDNDRLRRIDGLGRPQVVAEARHTGGDLPAVAKVGSNGRVSVRAVIPFKFGDLA